MRFNLRKRENIAWSELYRQLNFCFIKIMKNNLHNLNYFLYELVIIAWQCITMQKKECLFRPFYCNPQKFLGLSSHYRLNTHTRIAFIFKNRRTYSLHLQHWKIPKILQFIFLLWRPTLKIHIFNFHHQLSWS